MEKKDVKAGEIDNGKVTIKSTWCKGCGICVAFCPAKALALENDKVVMPDPDKCIQCGMCELRCPDYAIYVGRKKNEKQV
jgi:2-oxoglutarate ferredoxin oxidoreductase subunit delta